MVVELIGKLSANWRTSGPDRGDQANAPNSPQMRSMREQAAAIEHQIQTERARIANNSDGLADKIEQYERLMLAQEFSVQTLAQAVMAWNSRASTQGVSSCSWNGW